MIFTACCVTDGPSRSDSAPCVYDRPWLQDVLDVLH